MSVLAGGAQPRAAQARRWGYGSKVPSYFGQIDPRWSLPPRSAGTKLAKIAVEPPPALSDSRGMRQATTILEFQTNRQGLVEITSAVGAWVADQQLSEGLLTLFCRHTSASLLVQENAAPEVRTDLEAYFARIAPEDPSAYAHNDEGLDDMPAHLRTALTQVQLSIPLLDGRLALGTWQGIYLFEHRRSPHRRSIALHLAGD